MSKRKEITTWTFSPPSDFNYGDMNSRPLRRPPCEHRWISVNERLPPHNETVLYTCDLGPNEGFTDVESGRWEGARNDMGQPAMRPVWGDEDDWGPCSHWMPLPAPPTDGK